MLLSSIWLFLLAQSVSAKFKVWGALSSSQAMAMVQHYAGARNKETLEIQGGHVPRKTNVPVPGDSEQLTVKPSLGALGCPCNTEVWWLHIPKAGTSFGYQSAQTCNQYKKEPRAKYHTPVRADASNEFLSKIVGMFRQPDQRLASELGMLGRAGPCHHDEQGHVTWCENFASRIREAGPGLFGLGRRQDEVADKVNKGITPKTDDFLGVAMQGCQTNMLNGRTCFEETLPNITHVESAIQKVNKMLFVGLQDEWFLSMCLFNRIVTGKRFVQPFQLINNRPSSGTASSEYDTRGWPKDRLDGSVYAAAKARFRSDLKKYDISKVACAQTYDGDPLEEEETN